MISYSDAVDLVKTQFSYIPRSSEYVKLEHSLHRVLAEDVFATNPLPPFSHATMDGIAIKFTPGRSCWTIIGESAAGSGMQNEIAEADCVLIMTGAKMPAGADTVIPIERIRFESNVAVRSDFSIQHGDNVRITGADLPDKAKALSAGSLITPARAGLLAACGYALVPVFRKLQIGIITTGNELVPVHSQLSGDKIRVSNSFVLSGLVKESGHAPVFLGHCSDDEETLLLSIQSALNSHFDILITTGGVSVGKYDLLPKVFKELDVETIFHGIRVRPGKPVFFGKSKNAQLVIGLPGNPVSSFVAFATLFSPLLYTVSGLPAKQLCKAVLANDIHKTGDFRVFLRGILTSNSVGNTVTTLESQASGSVTELAFANCLIQLEETVSYLPAGTEVTCIMI